ncbi:MAG TPA: dTDP-4-dehydrorhamnose reductase [Sphingomonas sp.]|jgi:dTDP-4-dehydrorhamnose reductase
MNHVLVTGARGQLGTELARVRWPEDWQAVPLGRAPLDLSDPDMIAEIVADGHDGQPWAALINAGAYTAVDKAESDAVAAWMVNALAPAAMGAACARAGIPLVQISTDYVFPGDRDGAWGVDDPVGPLGVYGASKLGGELAVRTSGARHAIVRTAWVVSAHGSNFVKTMLRVGAQRESVRVVDDQRGSPTSAADLAAALVTIAVRLAEDPHAPTGIFHFANAGADGDAVSWAGFAREIFRQSALRGGPCPVVEPITTADYPTPARRPANSLLGTGGLQAAYGITPRPWDRALSDILDELIGPDQ